MVMAQVYTMCGQYEDALDEIDYLLSQESSYTFHNIEIEPILNPLKTLPRYREIINKYQDISAHQEIMGES